MFPFFGFFAGLSFDPHDSLFNFIANPAVSPFRLSSLQALSSGWNLLSQDAASLIWLGAAGAKMIRHFTVDITLHESCELLNIDVNNVMSDRPRCVGAISLQLSAFEDASGLTADSQIQTTHGKAIHQGPDTVPCGATFPVEPDFFKK